MSLVVHFPHQYFSKSWSWILLQCCLCGKWHKVLSLIKTWNRKNHLFSTCSINQKQTKKNPNKTTVTAHVPWNRILFSCNCQASAAHSAIPTILHRGPLVAVFPFLVQFPHHLSLFLKSLWQLRSDTVPVLLAVCLWSSEWNPLGTNLLFLHLRQKIN